MMDIAVRAAARPGQRRLVLPWAVMAGIAAGLVIGLAAPMARRIPGRRRICGVPARMGRRGAQTVLAARRTRLDSLRQILLTR